MRVNIPGKKLYIFMSVQSSSKSEHLLEAAVSMRQARLFARTYCIGRNWRPYKYSVTKMSDSWYAPPLMIYPPPQKIKNLNKDNK